jgi:hypothetical protein
MARCKRFSGVMIVFREPLRLSGCNCSILYKGASAFDPAGAGPNVARCGVFPENIELSFTGQGVDTEGGFNTAVFSACANVTTNTVFDLEGDRHLPREWRSGIHRSGFFRADD